MPVPAGISFPMMTFSFRPSRPSDLPSIAASVSTRVVSWNEVAVDVGVTPGVDLLAGQERAVAGLGHRDAAQHLADDHLDVLVVDRHTLLPVDLLHLAHEVHLRLPDALHLEQLLRVERRLLVTDQPVTGAD